MEIIHSDFLQKVFFANSILDYFIFIGLFFLVLIFLKILKKIVISSLVKLSRKTKTKIDDILIEGVKAIHWPLYVVIALIVSLNFLEISLKVEKGFNYLFFIIVLYYIGKIVVRLINYGSKEIIAARKEKDENTAVVKLLAVSAKVVLWGGILVLVLANLGYNVTSLIAGLGIGGIAVALAIQNILSDVFSSFSIYFDKPFLVGDFITVGEHSGVVKKIGIKSTRIQALQGEEVVISNNELTSAKIQNFGKMEKRRVLFSVQIVYSSGLEKIKLVNKIIKEAIEARENTQFDRVHFKSFAEYSLSFEAVYYILTGDYAGYMDTQEMINLEIYEKFSKEKIEFALPTKKVVLEK